MCPVGKIEKIIFAHFYKKLLPPLLPSVWQRQDKPAMCVCKQVNDNRLGWSENYTETFSFLPLIHFIQGIWEASELKLPWVTWKRTPERACSPRQGLGEGVPTRDNFDKTGSSQTGFRKLFLPPPKVSADLRGSWTFTVTLTYANNCLIRRKIKHWSASHNAVRLKPHHSLNEKRK